MSISTSPSMKEQKPNGNSTEGALFLQQDKDRPTDTTGEQCGTLCSWRRWSCSCQNEPIYLLLPKPRETNYIMTYYRWERNVSSCSVGFAHSSSSCISNCPVHEGGKHCLRWHDGTSKSFREVNDKCPSHSSSQVP